MTPVFDGHNDFLLRLLNNPEGRAQTWLEGNGSGHLDLPRMRKGGFAGGFFAIYISSPRPEGATNVDDLMEHPPYALPLPAPLTFDASAPVALKMAGHLRWMERQGGLRLIELPMSRTDIGDYLGLTIETVSRAFTKLKQSGVIRLQGLRNVEIVKWQVLSDMAS